MKNPCNINKVPETDEEVKAVFDNSFSATAAIAVAAYDLYSIFRSRDGLSVVDAYEKTLQHIRTYAKDICSRKS
jgi:hypothetical protein